MEGLGILPQQWRITWKKEMGHEVEVRIKWWFRGFFQSGLVSDAWIHTFIYIYIYMKMYMYE